MMTSQILSMVTSIDPTGTVGYIADKIAFDLKELRPVS